MENPGPRAHGALPSTCVVQGPKDPELIHGVEHVVLRGRVHEVSAKARGRNGGRPSKQNAKGEVVKALADSGMKIVDIVKETGLSRSTVNRILRDSK